MDTAKRNSHSPYWIANRPPFLDGKKTRSLNRVSHAENLFSHDWQSNLSRGISWRGTFGLMGFRRRPVAEVCFSHLTANAGIMWLSERFVSARQSRHVSIVAISTRVPDESPN